MLFFFLFSSLVQKNRAEFSKVFNTLFDLAKDLGHIIGKLEYLTESPDNLIDPIHYMPYLFFHLSSLILQRNLPEVLVDRIGKLISLIGGKFVQNVPTFQEPLLELLLVPSHSSEQAYLHLLPNFNPVIFVSK